jgi:8-oxo-dGTP diphosphatase
MANDSNHKPRVNPNVSVDCAIFGFDFEELKVLLIERSEPNEGVSRWALPGDLILQNESLDEAATRVLRELTGLHNIFLDQFHTFGNPDRVRRASDAAWLQSIRDDPGARVITVAYNSLVKIDDVDPKADSFARSVQWFPIDQAPDLAFDHGEILNKGLDSLKDLLRKRPIGLALLPPKFTLGQLQKLYEAILRIQLDKRNFRKKILKQKLLVPLDEKQKGVPHKPAQYYRFNPEVYKAENPEDYDFALADPMAD